MNHYYPMSKGNTYAESLAAAAKTRELVAKLGYVKPTTPVKKPRTERVQIHKSPYVTQRNILTQFKKKPAPSMCLPHSSYGPTVPISGSSVEPAS